jgi:fluoroacetyl-CoA thioesterase
MEGSWIVRELPENVAAGYRHRVTEQDTASRWRNDLPVLATPVLLWLSEITAMEALAGFLEDGEMTVGLSHDSSHLAATPVGHEVSLTAVLVERRGNRLVFEVSAHDGVDVVLRGRHTRAVVARGNFLLRLAAKENRPAA